MTTSCRWIDQRSRLLFLAAPKLLTAIGFLWGGSSTLLAQQTTLPPPSTIGNNTAVCGPTTIVTTAGDSVTVTGTGVSFVASSQITFNPGFSSEAGATFTASIGSCGSTTQYFLTTSANTSTEGSISPGSEWVNSGTPVSVSASPSSGYRFTGFSGALSGTTTPQTLTVTGTMGVTANFAPTTGTITNLSDLQTCLNTASQATCVLGPGTFPVTNTLSIARYGVTLSGSNTTADHTQTRLVRGSSFGGSLIHVAVPGIDQATATLASTGLTGIVIQNLTVCGAGNSNPNTTPGFPPAVMSPTGAVSLTYPCADHNVYPPSSACNYTNQQCVDLNVTNVDSGYYPGVAGYPYPSTNPFAYTGPYALEINNVDMEDAAGHALVLYAAGPYQGPPSAPPQKVNDIYIHNSVINYSALHGILYGANFVNYDRKFCDGDVVNGVNVFNNDTTVYTPRDIRIENVTFNNNNTVVMGNQARWVGLRYSTFTNNYISPQADYGPGGGVLFDTCADTVQIYNNTMTGPSPSTYDDTSGLELHGRNIDIQGNAISSYPNEGFSINSAYNTNIANNTITNNDQNLNYRDFPAGGIVLRTSPPTSPDNFCGQIERDTNLITISTNTVTGQAYGVEFYDFGLSRNTFGIQGVLDDVAIAQNNVLSGNPAIALDDQMITLINYSGPNAILANSGAGFAGTPRALGVDAVSPETSRCSAPGADRETFTFEATDSGGASNVAWIQAVFSQNGCDGDGDGPPCFPQPETNITLIGAPGCHFMYFPANNAIYLDGPNVNSPWSGGSSVVGPGGTTLSNSYCTIYAGSSASQVSTEPRILDLTLDIQFATGTQNNKHIYVVTENNQGQQSMGPTLTGTWNYWGWWFAQ